MKKVKTLLSIFLCVFAFAIFGLSGCTNQQISVVAIGIAGVSDNLVKDDGTDRYLVRKGETFTITYEVKPAHASDLTTYVDVTPANKISTDITIFKTKEAKNTVTFKSSSVNIGETLIKFTTKDGGATVSIKVEIIDDDRIFSKPQNLKYSINPQTGKGEFTWDRSTVETNNGLIEANKYKVFINDETFETETTSLQTELQSGVDYYVRVQALGNLKTRTSNSEISSDERFYVAKTPTNFDVNNGVITWDYDDEDNINQFVLEFDQYKVTLPKDLRSFDVAHYIKQQSIAGLGNFNVKLTAVNTEFVNGAPNDGNIMTYIINSRNNPTLSLTQLYAPTNVALNNQKQAGDIYDSTMLEWDSVTSASSYVLAIFKNGQQIGQLTSGTNSINLSKAQFVRDAVASKSTGEYTIKITPMGDVKTTFSEADDFATIDFIITPFLYGSVDYNTDKLNLLTQDLLTMLGLSSDDLASKLKYEIYYSKHITGYYDNLTVVNNPTSNLNLSAIINMDYAYNVLVRPVPTGAYTTTNVVLPMIDEIQFNRTLTSMVNQLKPVTISNVDIDGVLTATDVNVETNVDAYRFELTGETTSTQTIYRNNPNLVFDGDNFTISVVELFNIQTPGDYSIRIVPVSSFMIDGNPNYCNTYAFKKLGSIDTATIEIDNNVITWEGVANFSSYSIKINDEEEVVINSNSYAIEDNSILEDNNTITIKVNGNGTNTISGATASITKPRAVAVTGFEVVNGVLTWEDSVANSTFYITITYPQENVEKVIVNTNSYSGLDKIATSAIITISRGVPTAFNSAESDEISISRLATPTNDMSLVNHTSTAKFTKVENAYSYNVIVKQGSTPVKEYMISTNGTTPNATLVDESIQFVIAELNAGNYSLFVQAIPSDQNASDYSTNNTFYLISDLSQNNDFVVYSQIEVINKTHTLDWTFDSTYNVKDYTISFVNNEHEDIVTVANSYNFAEVVGGEYELMLSVSSTAENVIYPTNTAVTVVKTITPTIAYNLGQIEFTLADTAIEYEVYSGDDTLLVNNVDYKITISGNTAFIAPLNLQEGVDYSIYIVAIGNTDVLDGDKSNVVEFSIVDSVSGIALTTVDDDKVFTWSSVEHSSGYAVELKQASTVLESVVITENSYTIPAKYFSGADKFVAGTYTLSITVLSETLVNSNPVSVDFTKLGVVSNTNVTGNTITWEYAGSGVPTGYEVLAYTYQSGVWVLEETFNVVHVNGVTPEFNLEQLSDYDNYQIAIIVVGSDASLTLNGEKTTFTYTYGDSNENTGDTFTKVQAPTFTYNAGKLQLIGNDDAQSYELYSVNGGEYTLLTYEYTFDANLYINLTEVETTYTIVAKAIAKDNIGKLNSVYSEEIKINKLATIDDLVVGSTGLISWTADENATSYLVYNITTGATLSLDGQATNSVTYEYLYTQFDLDLGSTNEFAIIVVGNIKNGVNYLNSELSNSVAINAVENIQTIGINNGTLTWDDIVGVTAYKVDIVNQEYGNLIKSVVVNTNSLNINSYTEIANGMKTEIKIMPCTTNDTSYIITDEVTATSIIVSRYDIIDAISVENGLIKFKLDISKISLEDVMQIISATDYSTLSEDIKQGYYGYYNFHLNVNGTNINITLQDMKYTIDTISIASKVFYATYNLGYNVQATTLLNIKISSMGNTATNAVNYGAIASIPTASNNTILLAYKHSAPVPTASSNLVGENGSIEFRKIAGVDKYILTAESRNEVLTLEIDTTMIPGETCDLGNVSALNFKTSGGGTKQVNGDIEYLYTLTTLGTVSGDSGDLYLRSNPYTQATILFLSKPSVNYVYNDTNTLGGYITWTENTQALGYKIYALNVEDTDIYLEAEKDSIKTNSLWIGNPEVYTCEVGFENTTYMFENAGFSHGVGIDAETDISLPNGSYWIAIQAVGNGTSCITPAGCNNTIEIYKVNPVVNTKMQNGAFEWELTDADKSFVAGFRIDVNVYDGGVYSKTLSSATLTPKQVGDNIVYSYVLDELFTDSGNVTHTLNGISDSGGKESYGISIVAIGGSLNSKTCVNSVAMVIDNAGVGYERLDASVLGIDNGSLTWTFASQSVNDVKEYQLFIGGVETGYVFNDITNTFSFDNGLFDDAGDYVLSIKAIAESNNYLSSAKSQELTAVKFHAPRITTENGVLVWNNSDNGAAYQPLNSTLRINSSDGTNDIAEKYTNQFSEFTFALSDRDQFPSGYYKAYAKYDGHYDAANAVYYIDSAETSVLTYKLDIPTIHSVPNFLAGADGNRECEKFQSCIKWPLVKDEHGQDIVRYQVVISIYNGFEFVIDQDLSGQPIENVKNSIYDEANAENTTLIVKDGYVYYNTSHIAGQVNNSVVQISVVALGTTSVGLNKYELNSSKALKEIDYSVSAPNLDDSDAVHGIIRWSGSDNAVFVTLQYGNVANPTTTNVYLDDEYIAKYGRVYYLPYMTTYSLVELRFVIGGSDLGNTSSIGVGTQSLFTSGEGTKESPYLITSASQLQNIQYRPLSHIRIASSSANLALSGNNNWTMLEEFGGVFDGNGSTISNIKFVQTVQGSENGNSTIYRSFFRTLMEGAVVKNLTLSYATSIGLSGTPIPATQNISTSCIAIDNYGTIENVVLTGNFATYGQKTISYGGAAVNNYGTIDGLINNMMTNINCSPTNATLSGTKLYGAGVAYNNFGLIDSSSLVGAINLVSNNAKNRQAAGIAVSNRGVIINSDFTGTLTAFDMAGIAYSNDYSENVLTVVKEYDSEGVVSCEYNAGTILGCYAKGMMYLASSTAAASSNICVAGIVGINRGGHIGKCYSIMDNGTMDFDAIKASANFVYTGGIVAFNSYQELDVDIYQTPTIEYSYAIVKTNFKETSNRLESGAVVGAFAQTIGLSVSYGENYGLDKVAYYSASDAFGASTSITIPNTDVLESLGSATAIADETHKTKLNNVTDVDKYSHIRVFYIAASELGLRLEKTIKK